MAYLKKVTNKVGKVYFLSLIQGVKHVGSKYISLDTDNKSEARVHHADVIEHEKEIKNGVKMVGSRKNIALLILHRKMLQIFG